MTITDLELEQIAEADKKAQRKANTLGADRPLAEEPFGNSSIVLREDLFARTPTATTGFASPDYGDAPIGGAVATRRVLARLHPLLPSGATGPNSIQTFVVVSAIPESDDPADVERVRIKHLVPSDLSLGRSHAAEDDPNLRGFELALYPGYSNAGVVEAYDGYGPIPISADPGAAYGVGSDGRWTVDYANGIVRLSVAPLNGLTGLFNPFNVFANRNGSEDSSPRGRLALFATFYHYTGPNLSQINGSSVNLVTVGDGYDSYGSFYGPTARVMQEAVDSLWPLGGTIFVNGGTYRYDRPVLVPRNVNIVGLTLGAKIYSQFGSGALFKFAGLDSSPNPPDDIATDPSNSSIRGLQLFSDDGYGAIEFGSDDDNETLENIVVAGNIIWSNATSKGVTFSPTNTGIVYKNCRIENNQFKTNSTSTTYIGETTGGSAQIDGLYIGGNTFDSTTSPSDAISITGVCISLMSRIKLDNNKLSSNNVLNQLNINLNNGVGISGFECLDSYQSGSLSVYGLADSMISRSTFLAGINVADDVVSTTFADGYLGNVYVAGNVTDYLLSNNTCGIFSVAKTATRLKCVENHFLREFFVTGEFGSITASDDINDLLLEGNRFDAEVYLSRDLISTDTHSISGVKILGNHFKMRLVVGDNPAAGAVTLVYTNTQIARNTFENVNSATNAIVFGNATVVNSDFTINYLDVSDNYILRGNIMFLNNVVFNSSSEVSSISGNKIEEAGYGIYIVSTRTNDVEISHNSLDKIILFGYNSVDITLIGVDPATSTDIIISDNIMKGSGAEIAFAPVNPAVSLTLNNVNIRDNIFLNTGSILVLNSAVTTNDYRINYLSVCDNQMSTAGSVLAIGPSVTLTPGGILFNDAIIDDNNVNGSLSVGGIAATRLMFSSNQVSGATTFSKALDTSTITDNTLLDVTFAETLNNSAFGNNNVYGTVATFTGTLTSTTIEGNNIDANVLFSAAITSCNVNDNRITGTLTQSATADGCTFSDNMVNAWSSAAWDNSTFSGNTITSTFSATTMNDTSFKDSRIEGDASITVVTNSSIGGLVVKGGAGLTITSLDTCTLADCVVSGTLTVSSAVNTSTISGNRLNTFSIIGLIDKSTISGNITVIGGATLAAASTVTESTITGNSFQSTNTNAAFVLGTITTCTITGNTFRAENGGAASTSFGNMISTAFSTNNIQQDTASAILFGTINNSTISGMVVSRITGGATIAVTCGSITHSEITDAYVDATFTVSSAFTAALVESSISNSQFILDFTLAMTAIDTTPAVISARLLNNDFEAGAFVNGALIAFRDSIVTGNNFKGNFNVSVTASAGTYALEDTVLSDNRITSALIINNTSGSAASANIARRSIISNNEIGGDCLIGANVHITNATNLFEEVNFNSNHIAGNLILGPLGRTVSLTTYMSSSFSGNTVGATGGFGDLIVRGAMVGCAFGNNIMSNNSTFDLISGGTSVGNVFGADGNGTVTLTGGLQNNAVFSNNFAVGLVTVSSTISSAVLSNNTINGELELNGALSSCDLSNNIISGLLDINATVTSATISDNTLTAAVDFSTTVSGSIFSDNIMGTTLTFNGAITGLNMSGNYSTSTLSFVAGVTNLNMSENRFGAVSMNSASGKDEIALGNNTLASLTINNSTLTDASIQGNRISGAVNISTSQSMSNSIFNDNACGGAVSFGTLNHSTIDGNYTASDFNFDSTIDYSSISNNNVNNMIFDLAVDQSQILGNNTQTDMTFTTTMNSITFVGNVVGDDSVGDFAAIGAITDCVFSANDFRHACEFPAAAVTSVSFTGNHIGGAFSDSGVGGTHVYTGLTMSSNTFDSSITLEGQLVRMQFANNYVGAAALFDSSVAGGTVVNSVINGNMFDDSLTIANDGASAAPLITSTISNNRIDTTFAITASGGTGGGACSEAVIEGNTIGSTTTLTGLSAAIMTDSVFRDNTCQGVTLTGAATLAGLVNTIVSGNVIDGDINIHTGLTGVTAVLLLNESIVSGNTVDGSIFMGNAARDGDVQTYLESIVSGNTCIVMTMYGALYDIDLIGNIISGSTGNLTTGGLVDTRISGNVIQNTSGATNTAFGFNCGTNPVILNCIISDNDFFENVTPLGAITGTRIMNNRFAGSFDATGVVMTTVNIGSNYFGGTFLTGQWSSVSCMGNQFVGAFTLSSTVTSVIDDVSFQVNVCQSSVTFARPSSGTSNNFVQSSFTGNVFDGAVSFGSDTFTNEMVRVVFNSNSGGGGLTFYTGASSEMDGCMIVGNNMAGVFTIDDNVGGTYPMPPTTGGTGQFIMALNWFSGYNGVTFTDSQAIGWGNNLTGTAISTVVGSNLS